MRRDAGCRGRTDEGAFHYCAPWRRGRLPPLSPRRRLLVLAAVHEVLLDTRGRLKVQRVANLGDLPRCEPFGQRVFHELKHEVPTPQAQDPQVVSDLLPVGPVAAVGVSWIWTLTPWAVALDGGDGRE